MAEKKIEKEKLKVGRPTDYKPEYCYSLIKHMAEGLSFESFGATINVGRDCVFEWANKHKEFSDAKKMALDLNLIFWEKLGVKGLWNDSKGLTFNTALWIFNMKNRHGWRDKKDINVEGIQNALPQIIVSLPDNGMTEKKTEVKKKVSK